MCPGYTHLWDLCWSLYKGGEWNLNSGANGIEQISQWKEKFNLSGYNVDGTVDDQQNLLSAVFLDTISFADN